MKNVICFKSSVGLLCLMYLLINGCRNGENDWNQTKELNTTDAYVDFIKKHPKSIYGDDIRSILKDEIKQMHDKAIKIWDTEQENYKTETKKIYSDILQINPKDALALNNMAFLVCVESGHIGYSKALDLLELSLENANQQRILNVSPTWVLHGGFMKLAQPSIGEKDSYPLRELVLYNIEILHKSINSPL